MVKERIPNSSNFLRFMPSLLLLLFTIFLAFYEIENTTTSLDQESNLYGFALQQLRPRSVSHTLDDSGFTLGRSPTQFISQTSFAKKEGNNDEFLYDSEDLRMIVRAVTTMRSFTNQGLWSGSEAPMHFLGTGSCLVKLKQSAVDVAVGVMHSTYLQKWREHVKIAKESTCDMRRRMQTVIGSEAEQALWLGTGLFGNGPWNSCLWTYLIALEEEEKNNDMLQNSKLSNFLRDVPLSMLLCDEIEEAIGGESILSGHWKRRDAAHFDLLKKLASKVNLDEQLLIWIDQAREMSHAVHHPNPVERFKELTPACVADLLETDGFDAFHPELSRGDKSRFLTMINMTLIDRYMLPRYNGSKGKKELLTAIKWSRIACDNVVAHNMTLDDYLTEYNVQKEKLLECEHNDSRFNKPIPVPLTPPEWALMDPLWSSHLHYP